MSAQTLNVLLSFAQFEREVTSERIRDKIAASKRKGLWVGAMAPLGYDTKDRKIFINDTEADRVRTIFRSYITIRKPDTATHLPSQYDELMSERSVFCLKSALRLERRDEQGQPEAEQ